MKPDPGSLNKKLKFILKQENLEHLLPCFAEGGVTDSTLGELSDADLREIGIGKLGERKRLLAAFRKPQDGAVSETMVRVEGGTMPEESEFAGTKVRFFS